MFKERLKHLRNSKGISQNDLAVSIGFSRGQIGNYEQGTREPNYKKLIKFADYFGVSTDYLLGLTDEISPPCDWVKLINKANEHGISPQDLTPILEIIKQSRSTAQEKG